MTRFRQLSTDVSADADVKALMDDIDASLADLEKRIEVQQSAPTLSVTERPPLAANLPEIAVAADEPASAPASDFLAELEREATALSGSGESEARQRQLRQRRVHEALGHIFRFFDAFCRHANVLAPAIARPYRLDANIAYDGLKWQEATVRYRLQNLREKALMDYVALTIRLAAPAPVAVTRRWDQVEQLKKEMHVLDLRAADGIDIDDKPLQENVSLLLAPDFPVQLTFRGNYSRGRVDLLSRNLDGFGIAAFVCDAEEVDQTLLDDLGRFLLDRTNRLPVGLNQVQLRSQL
jgi:hypothetical protein